MRYMSDGSVVSSKVSLTPRGGAKEHQSLFGLYRGVVIKSIYPDDKENSSKTRMEYSIRVNGIDYPNAVNAREAGGVYNYRERIRKGSEIAIEGADVNRGTVTEVLDGEFVYVMFLNGNGNVPIIIGSAPHPQQSKYKKAKKEDGIFDEYEFNGVSVKIDKDSNYIIEQLGRKDPKDKTFKKIQNEKAKGAQIKIGGKDGDITIKAAQEGLFNIDKEGSIKFVSKDGSIVHLDATNGTILIVSKDGNTIKMDSSAVVISEKTNKSIITLKGDTAEVESKKVLIKSENTEIGASASFSAVLYENLKTVFDAHQHATVLGPSGPPLPPNTLTLNEASPATAAKSSFIKLRGNV